MPDIQFLLQDHYKKSEFTFAPPVNRWPRACLNDSSLHLVRLNGTESDYSPSGTYRETIVEFPRYYANGLTGFYAFKHIASGDGTIGYQFSNDGGQTWYTYTTTWVPATGGNATVYLSESEADAHIQTFPVTEDKSFRLRVRLTPGTNGSSTPILHQVILSVTLDFDYQDDFLKSMMIHLEDNVRVRVTLYYDAKHTNIAAPEHQWGNFVSPVEMYNIDTDPNKTTNLFKSIQADPAGCAFEMTSKQTGRIEIHTFAVPTVYISSPEAWMELSKSTAIVINDNNIKKMGEICYGEDETEYHYTEFKARQSPSRVYFKINSTVSVQASLKHEAEALADALERALNQYQYIHSYGSGEFYKVLDPTPITLANRVALGLFTKDYSSTIFGRAWLRPDLTKEVDLVQRIRYISTYYGDEGDIIED